VASVLGVESLRLLAGGRLRGLSCGGARDDGFMAEVDLLTLIADAGDVMPAVALIGFCACVDEAPLQENNPFLSAERSLDEVDGDNNSTTYRHTQFDRRATQSALRAATLNPPPQSRRMRHTAAASVSALPRHLIYSHPIVAVLHFLCHRNESDGDRGGSHLTHSGILPFEGSTVNEVEQLSPEVSMTTFDVIQAVLCAATIHVNVHG